ncbi:MAG: DNA polymerase III subunit beta [Thermodesulfobacteriota bacterium]|nr:DNA polymerase III subunit beta [Thermodesulfobacteriota bacterium]
MMEFKIKKEKVLPALTKVQGITGKKSTLPITSNVVIYAKEGYIVILATDLEIAFQGHYEAEVVAQGGSAVPSRKVYEIVRDFPSDVVAFKESENRWIQIADKTIEYNIVGMETETFPGLPEVESVPLFDMDGDILKNMLEKTMYAALSDEGRVHLAGVFFETITEGEERFFRMVSTDGHRLSRIDEPIDKGSGFELEEGVIVPKSGIVEILRLIEGGGTVQVGLRDKDFIVKKDSETLIIRLIEGEFPDYNLVIPKEIKREVRVEKEVLLMMLKRMSILSSDKYRSMRFKIDKEQMETTTTNPDIGESREVIPVRYNGEGMEIAFNPRYFVDCVSHMKSEEVIIRLNDEATPCVVEGDKDKGFLSVIMPMRI